MSPDAPGLSLRIYAPTPDPDHSRRSRRAVQAGASRRGERLPEVRDQVASRSSSPTESRTSPSRDAERARVCVGVRRWCVVVAGCVTRDFASPRLFEISTMRSAFEEPERRLLAAREVERRPSCRRSPSAARASACCGWSGEARVDHARQRRRRPRQRLPRSPAAPSACARQRRSSVSRPLSMHPGVERAQRAAGVLEEGSSTSRG